MDQKRIFNKKVFEETFRKHCKSPNLLPIKMLYGLRWSISNFGEQEVFILYTDTLLSTFKL